MIEIVIIIALIALMARFLPSLILLSQFSYPNAKFSAIENKFLKEKELTKLLECKNLEELKNNVISRDFIIEGENVKEMQESIEKSLIKLLLMAKNDSPKKVRDFYDAYMEKIDAEKLKRAIRSLLEEKEIEEKAYSQKIKNIIEKLKKADREQAELILKEYGYEIDFEKSVEEIEKEIDKKAIERLLLAELPKNCRKARDKFVGILIDILNLKTIFRGKYYGMDIEKILLDGGWEISEWQIKELLKLTSIPEIISTLEGASYFASLRQAITDFEKEGVIALERALDKHLLKVANEIANEFTLNIGPGIRFIVEKEFEARNLMAIVKAVGEGMQEEAKKVLVME